MLLMSVKMALAKLCACTCGGAIIGGGAVQLSANPPPRPAIVSQAKARSATVETAVDKGIVRRSTAKRRVARKEIRRTVCRQTPGQTVTTRTIVPPMFVPPPPPPPVVTPRNQSWQASLRQDLQACSAQGFFDRPSCAWAARNKYCEPNNAWGKVGDCPAKSF